MKIRVFAAAAIATGLASGAVLPPGAGIAATMQCAPYQVISTPYLTGTTYTADRAGIVTGIANNDIAALDNFGCTIVGVGGETLIGRLVGANMNSTADQSIPMLIAANQSYTPTAVVVRNCSVSLTTAAGSFYSAAAKGGTTLAGSGATQAFSGCTATGLTGQTIAATAAGGNVVLPASTPPILSLTTAQGAAATADVYVYGRLGQ
jgi:hypothetical protein